MAPPRAYQEGRVNFYGLDFQVNASTLIPRPETEQLVEKTLALAKQYLSSKPHILDIGTGSGVIAVTLKKLLPKASVEASDISTSALTVAKRNAIENEVEVIFHTGNLFETISAKYDLIVANLPYVPAARWRFLESNVRDFEPKDAIVAGREGLKWIELFSQQVSAFLKRQSVVALEIDDNHAVRVHRLLQAALPNHELRIEQDLARRDRFAFALPIAEASFNPSSASALISS